MLEQPEKTSGYSRIWFSQGSFVKSISKHKKYEEQRLAEYKNKIWKNKTASHVKSISKHKKYEKQGQLSIEKIENMEK